MWGIFKSRRELTTVDTIRDRLAAEAGNAARAVIAQDDEQTGRSTVTEHSAPPRLLTIGQARRTMQAHRECDRATCPRKMAAVNVLVAAGVMRLAPRARY